MLKTLLKKLPPIAALVAERDALLTAHGMAPPGHFYSPVVSIAEATKDAAKLFEEVPDNIPGVDLNEIGQLDLLSNFEKLYPTIDFPDIKSAGHRYYYDNPAYSYSDAIILNCMMRHFRPSRIIEVGSGYSSCAILDTNEIFLGNSVSLTCIEPYPKLLQSLLSPKDIENIKIIPSRLQDVDLAEFRRLQPGDFLFIDSTHVSKTGSDVNYLIADILPVLNDGVHIHIHDIFYPFEYPKEWVLGGRSWNEVYVIRAFLKFNSRFKIEIMNTYLEHFHRSRFAEKMPLCLKNLGGSIWLMKTDQPSTAVASFTGP